MALLFDLVRFEHSSFVSSMSALFGASSQHAVKWKSVLTVDVDDEDDKEQQQPLPEEEESDNDNDTVAVHSTDRLKDCVIEDRPNDYGAPEEAENDPMVVIGEMYIPTVVELMLQCRCRCICKYDADNPYEDDECVCICTCNPLPRDT
jgi:hypothetical protein